MKKWISLTLVTLLMISLCGCVPQNLSVEMMPTVTEETAWTESTAPPESTAVTTEPTEKTEETQPTEETEATEPTQPTEVVEETKPQKETESTKETEETKPKEPPATQPTQPTTEPTEPVTKPTESTTEPTVPPTTEPEETKPAETQPPETEPVVTEPAVTQPTTPTEPVGCQHDWKCIHHAEEGHWLAGVVCDCGWTAYGDPDTLVAKWNAHSASYPAAESLFDHGGYGCVDEWVVDKQAYDEWVCRHCGEPKP